MVLGLEPLDWFDFKLREISSHVASIEELLEREALALETRIEEHAQTISDPEARAEYYEHFGEDSYQLRDLFPQMQRQANLIAVMSAVESELNSLCDHVAAERSQPLRVEDLRGRGIRRAEQYLTKVCEIDESWKSPSWKEIRQASEIRNAFIHNDGYVDEPNLLKFINASPSLDVKISREGATDGYVKIKKTYVPHVIANFETLYRLVVSEIKSSGG